MYGGTRNPRSRGWESSTLTTRPSGPPLFTLNVSNDLDMFKVKNTYTYAWYIHTARPKFSSILLYDERFLSYALFSENAETGPHNALHMFKVKNTNMHSTYTLEAQIFVRFAIRWIVGKVHRMTPNDLDMFKVKRDQHSCYIHSEGPNFRPFHSTMSRLEFQLRPNF